MTETWGRKACVLSQRVNRSKPRVPVPPGSTRLLTLDPGLGGQRDSRTCSVPGEPQAGAAPAFPVPMGCGNSSGQGTPGDLQHNLKPQLAPGLLPALPESPNLPHLHLLSFPMRVFQFFIPSHHRSFHFVSSSGINSAPFFMSLLLVPGIILLKKESQPGHRNGIVPRQL